MALEGPLLSFHTLWIGCAARTKRVGLLYFFWRGLGRSSANVLIKSVRAASVFPCAMRIWKVRIHLSQLNHGCSKKARDSFSKYTFQPPCASGPAANIDQWVKLSDVYDKKGGGGKRNCRNPPNLDADADCWMRSSCVVMLQVGTALWLLFEAGNWAVRQCFPARNLEIFLQRISGYRISNAATYVM